MLPPEYVSLGDDGYYKVEEVSPWKLVKAVQELKDENEELKARIAKLEDAALRQK